MGNYLTEAEQESARKLYRETRNAAEVARQLGRPPTTIREFLARERQITGAVIRQPLVESPPVSSLKTEPTWAELMLKSLRRQQATLAELAQNYGVTQGQILDELHRQRAAGVNLHQHGEAWAVERDNVVGPSSTADAAHFVLPSNAQGEYLIGCVGDSHLGSKYERLDVLNDLYDIYAREGVTRVYHCGNWIEGEARFNRFDVRVHGMDAQTDYLIQCYPQRPGITTYYIAGDDHEGWYAQREGVDIGRYLELKAREAGRTDLVYLGYMEAFVALRHAQTGAEAQMLICHPGGGSAYADSYMIQKIIESYEGGEKPGVAFYGHYHKMLSGEYRNVWWSQVGCTKDQDPFARKKRLRYVIGGTLNWFKQDECGSIVRFRSEMLRYFNKGYYNGQWSHSGPVTKAPLRSLGDAT